MAQKVTIYDVANAAGVSIATVNRALYNKPRVNEDTRKRIIGIAAEMGYAANRAAQALSRNPITIGVILSLSIPEVFSDTLDGVTMAIRSLSTLNVRSEVRSVKQDYDDLQADVDAYKSLVRSGCNGIIILSGSRIDGLNQAISSAREKGILTATVVTDLPSSPRALSVRSDGECAGRMAAEEFSKLCPGETVAVFASTKDTPICAENLRGFAKGCREYGIKQGPIFENRDYPLEAYHAVDELYGKHPEVRGIYICSANSETACKRLRELGLESRYKIVATDLFASIAQNIKSGIIDSTLFQNLQRQGELAVKTLYKKLTGELSDENKELLIVPELVMRSNVDSVMRRISEEMQQNDDRWKTM